MKHTLAFMAFLLLLTACGSNEGNTPKNAMARPSATEAPMPYPNHSDNWYRQFKGTIAGKQVTVDLECSMGQISGYYSYEEVGKLLSLYSVADSFDGTHFYIYENDPTSHNEVQDDHWSVYIFFDSGRVSGEWISQDATRKYDINLEEVDYKSSYRFYRFSNADSLIVPMKGFSVSAHTENKWCMPGDMPAADKEFLSSSILKILGCKDTKNVQACIKEQDRQYFADYKSQLEEGVPQEQSHMYDHELLRGLSVVYNKNSMVILETSFYQYSGGAHGMHGVGYNCIDVAGKKIWQLADVMTVDTAALSAILETEARRIFKIAAGEKLSERLLVDTIDVTDNFYFTSAGVTFVYGPYAIASYADGDVYLFIPYSRLSAYLTPEFKKRMQLL